MCTNGWRTTMNPRTLAAIFAAAALPVAAQTSPPRAEPRQATAVQMKAEKCKPAKKAAKAKQEPTKKAAAS